VIGLSNVVVTETATGGWRRA